MLIKDMSLVRLLESQKKKLREWKTGLIYDGRK